MTPTEFEKYWQQHRDAILSRNRQYQQAREKYKMNSGADWILFAIPAVSGVIAMNNTHVDNELLRWITSAIITFIVFVVCVWVKGLVSGKSSPDEIERRIKEEIKRKMVDEE